MPQKLSRTFELILAAACLSLVGLSIYLVLDAARTSELTWAAVRQYWGVSFVLLMLMATVAVLGARLAFPALRSHGRVVGRSGVLAFGIVYLTMFLFAWWRTGQFPIQGLPVLLGFAIGVTYAYSRRDGADA